MPSAGTPARPRKDMTNVVVVTNSAAAGERAATLFGGCENARMYAGEDTFQLLRSVSLLLRRRTTVLYVVDIGRATAIVAVLGRFARQPVVVDTGDLVYELESSRGARSRLSLALVRAGEKAALRSARHIVVRGTEHLEHLRGRPATLAPDLAPANARPVDGGAIRESLGLGRRFVIGLVGSMNTAPRLGITYGWEIVDALSYLDDRFAAIFVGDGPGRPQLERRASELGVVDRCRFVGAIYGEAVFKHVGAFDVGISTQTNDVVGSVRTTGKLPLYLACGCPVIATDVGEARRLIGSLGWTIRYDGVVDPAYPQRLADCLRRWADAPDAATAAQDRREAALSVHAREFNSTVVRQRVHASLAALLGTYGGDDPSA